MSTLEYFCSKSASCRNFQQKNLKFLRSTFICKFCHTLEPGIDDPLPQPFFLFMKMRTKTFLLQPLFPHPLINLLHSLFPRRLISFCPKMRNED